MNDEQPAIENNDEAWTKLGGRLRRSREYLGLSQGEVALYLGVPRPAVTNMESGKRKVSTLELARLARLYRQPYELLLGESPDLAEDETTAALLRATRALGSRDREQLLRFAHFLRGAGAAPVPVEEDDPG